MDESPGMSLAMTVTLWSLLERASAQLRPRTPALTGRDEYRS